MNIAHNNIIIVAVKTLFPETVTSTHIQLFKTILLENTIANNIEIRTKISAGNPNPLNILL